jgi:CAAX protease family protein
VRRPIALDPLLVRRSAVVLSGVTLLQGACIVLFPALFLAPLPRRVAEAGWLGWSLAALAALLYILYAVRGLSLQPYLRLLTPFKLLGPIMAVPTSILEEVFFRQMVMDTLQRAGQGALAQIAVSALVFGGVHVVWGVRGGLRAALNAVLATTVLGLLLGVVYLASQRVVLPCVLAHFVLNAVLEPWLVYAYALRGRGPQPAAVSGT